MCRCGADNYREHSVGWAGLADPAHFRRTSEFMNQSTGHIGDSNHGANAVAGIRRALLSVCLTVNRRQRQVQCPPTSADVF